MPFYLKQYPLTVCIQHPKITLPLSNPQATYAEENCHTLIVCISILSLTNQFVNLQTCKVIIHS